MALTATERKARSRARASGAVTPVTTELGPEDLAWLDRAAERRNVGREECLALLVGAQRRAESVAGKIGLTEPRHAFKPQRHNGLRCEHCGQRKAAH